MAMRSRSHPLALAGGMIAVAQLVPVLHLVQALRRQPEAKASGKFQAVRERSRSL